jgi:hypothetical protein
MKIENVFSFVACSKTLVYYSHDKTAICEFSLESLTVLKECVISENTVLNFFNHSQRIYLLSENSLYQFDLDRCNYAKNYPVNWFLVTAIRPDYFLGIEENTTEKKIILFSKEQLNRLVDLDDQFSIPIGYSNGILTLKGDDYLICRDLNQNKIVWENNFSKLGTYDDDGTLTKGAIESISILGSQIFVSVRGHCLFCLDAETGKEIWQQKFPRPIVKFEINERGKKIFIYNKITDFFILDLNTGEILMRKEIRNTWRQQGFDPWLAGFTVGDDFIYATAQTAKRIALIDKNTLDVVKLIPLETSEKIPDGNKPEIRGNYIFQLDGENALHVLDRNNILSV